MKIYLKYIFLFLIAGSIFSSCNQKDEKVYSFWALQNRATGEYLYETTANVNSAVKSKAISLCGK